MESTSSTAYKDNSLAINSTNVAELVFIYYDGVKHIMRHRNNSTSWAASGIDETISDDALCDESMYASSALSTANKLHVAYICKTAAGACKIYHATNASSTWIHTEVGTIKASGCTSGAITEAHRPSIALDSANAIHISYVDMDTTKLYHAIPSGGGFASTQLASGGFDSSIALDSAGKVYIFHRTSPTGANLMMMTDNSGSWVSHTIDGTSKVRGIGSAAVSGVQGQSNRYQP
jgi:hypothetical protein